MLINLKYLFYKRDLVEFRSHDLEITDFRALPTELQVQQYLSRFNQVNLGIYYMLL